VTGVPRLQVECVLADPRANAFTTGPTVFERKYELDSLCAPLMLAWLVWRTTGSRAHLDPRFRQAARTIVDLWRRDQQHDRDSYRFRRRPARRRDSLSHGGRGAPVAPTGMIWSGFRPSDDACVYRYHVPANAFAAVTLERLGEMLGEEDALAHEARALAAEVRAGRSRSMQSSEASTPTRSTDWETRCCSTTRTSRACCPSRTSASALVTTRCISRPGPGRLAPPTRAGSKVAECRGSAARMRVAAGSGRSGSRWRG
jgi:Metal-independent alpha-mannosidase (GH125)